MTHLQQLHEALGQADNLTIFAVSLCPDEVLEKGFWGGKARKLLPLVKAEKYQAIIAGIGDDCAFSRQSQDIFVTILNEEERKTALQTIAEKRPGAVKRILDRLPEKERAGLVTAKLLQTVATKDPGEVGCIFSRLPEKEQERLRQEMAANKPVKTSDVLQRVLVSRQNQRQ